MALSLEKTETVGVLDQLREKLDADPSVTYTFDSLCMSCNINPRSLAEEVKRGLIEGLYQYIPSDPGKRGYSAQYRNG